MFNRNVYDNVFTELNTSVTVNWSVSGLTRPSSATGDEHAHQVNSVAQHCVASVCHDYYYYHHN